MSERAADNRGEWLDDDLQDALLIERIARLEHERANPVRHSGHWYNPEAGWVECECCLDGRSTQRNSRSNSPRPTKRSCG